MRVLAKTLLVAPLWLAGAAGALAPIIVPPAPAPTTILPDPTTAAPTVAEVMPRLSEAQARLLRRMLDAAGSHGLPAYGAQVTGAAPDDPALIQAVMDYAHAVHGGRLRESDYMPDWGLRPAGFDPWPGFVQAAKDDRLATWVAALPPPYTGYDGLRRGLAAYRAIVDKGGWKAIPDGPDLTPGASGARVTALRRRLAIEDSGTAGDGPAAYDGDLAAAVKRAQKRFGLEPTGVANKATLAALNIPAASRVDAIVANLERWRWLPAQLPADRIQVNIAAAVLTLFKGDAPATSMRVVTGRPGDNTPMLSSMIHSVVLNPPWNVPTSIATKELWPKEKAHKGYLARSGFKVIENADGSKRLQQAPGPTNSLGRIKFDFANNYGVYLHDTPARGKFESYSRLASHGCVRLERPGDLAKLLLHGDPRWDDAAIDDAIAAGDTTRAKLPQPIAVYLLYWTAFAGSNGQMNFRGDPYGWDGVLATRIERGVPAQVAAK